MSTRAPAAARNSTRAPAVAARNLIKTYPGDVTALRGMDLGIEAGDGLRLLGPTAPGSPPP